MPVMHTAKVSKSASAPNEVVAFNLHRTSKPLRCASSLESAAGQPRCCGTVMRNLQCQAPAVHIHALHVSSLVANASHSCFTALLSTYCSVLTANVCCVRRRHRPSTIAGIMTSSATEVIRLAAGNGPPAVRRKLSLRASEHICLYHTDGVLTYLQRAPQVPARIFLDGFLPPSWRLRLWSVLQLRRLSGQRTPCSCAALTI